MGFLSGLFGGGDKVTTNERALSDEDAAAIRAGRDAGQASADAAMAGPWAQGVNPYTQQAADQFGQQYGAQQQFGDQWGAYGQQAMQGAMQTGMGAISPLQQQMMEQYRAGMDPVHAQNQAMLGMSANQNATGQGAYGGSRSAIQQAMAENQALQGRAAQYGQMQYQTGQDAMQFAQQERARMQQLGLSAGQMQQGAMGQQMGLSGNTAKMGDYMRNVAGQQAQDEFARRAAAQGQIQGGYGKDISYTDTKTEEGTGILGGIIGAATKIGSFALPGIGGALSGLIGGGGGGGQSTSQSPIMQSDPNIWNYGGRSGFGSGGK